MVRRIILLSAASIILLAAPAAAGVYDPPSVSGEVLSDGVFRVTGTGCEAGEDVTATADNSTEAVGTADEDGNFSIDLTIGTTPGTYGVEVVCGDVTQVLSATVAGGSVVPAASPSLPVTGGGDGSLSLARVGALAVLLGVGAVFVARRRRATAFTD